MAACTTTYMILKSKKSEIIKLTQHSHVVKTLIEKAFESTVEKGENAVNFFPNDNFRLLQSERVCR